MKPFVVCALITINLINALIYRLPHGINRPFTFIQKKTCHSNRVLFVKEPGTTDNLIDVNRLQPVELNDELKASFMSYAMSTILGRALPDSRDGLKPVHRRVLYAMHALGLAPDSSYRKCARVVGEVLGKFHPHGDQSVYDALVRMAQDFVMLHPLVAGHGKFIKAKSDFTITEVHFIKKKSHIIIICSY